MLDKISEYVGGGSILIVGNGEEVNEVEADVVVRMNFGVQEPCDIWVDNMSHKRIAKKVTQIAPHKFVVHTSKYFPKKVDGAYYLSSELARSMLNELNMERPSTGMMTLWLMKTLFPNNKKYITGYNGISNRYTNKKNVGPHEFARERKVVGEWINSGIFESI